MLLYTPCCFCYLDCSRYQPHTYVTISRRSRQRRDDVSGVHMHRPWLWRSMCDKLRQTIVKRGAHTTDDHADILKRDSARDFIASLVLLWEALAGPESLAIYVPRFTTENKEETALSISKMTYESRGGSHGGPGRLRDWVRVFGKTHRRSKPHPCSSCNHDPQL